MRERRRRARVAAGVVLALVLLGFGLLPGFAAAASADDGEGSASLTDDSGGTALFDASTPLLPGERRSACLSVAASSGQDDDVVLFGARDVQGTLGSALLVEVVTGTGGGHGSCDGFVGSRLFTGSLGALDVDRAGGVNTGWNPATQPVRTFRITVSLPPDAAAGTRARAGFVWRLVRADSVPPPPVPTDPTPDVTVPPLDPTPTTPPPTTSPAPSATGTAVAPPPSTPARPSRTTRPHSGAAPAADVVVKAATSTTKALRTVQAMAQTPQSLLVPAAVAGLFLLFQRQIDRRDPKLVAAARSSRDLEVAFPDPFARGRWHP